MFGNCMIFDLAFISSYLSNSLRSRRQTVTLYLSMDFVTPFLHTIERLCSAMGSKISSVVNLDQSVASLTTELKELQEIKEDLMRQVEQAELSRQERTSQVKGWLKRVEAIETKANSIVADLGQQRRCLGCCSARCLSACRLSREVLEMVKEVRELREKGAFDVIVNKNTDRGEVIPHRPTVGLDIMFEKVSQLIENDEIGIIGIYGMGGVGKTTLLKSINNEFLTRRHNYDVVIWITVSKDFAVDKFQQAVGKRLGLPWEETESREQQAMKIYRVMRRKRFLLLLDDVWEGIDLEKVGIPLPEKENKCKVILTSRSMDVCSDMDADQKLKVEFLGEKDSWELFCNKVGEKELLESTLIRPYAETIVRKCEGLPLALITIGRAMANKTSSREWNYATEVLNRSPSELRGMEDVFSLLKFSYDNLENDTLRSCFLYCSLFPEDYSLEKEQLVEYWIAEGFLDSSTDSNVYNKGYAVIGSLKVACLLETAEEKTQVKMHDVVRSFALWIASDFGTNWQLFVLKACMGLTEVPEVENWKEAQRISLLDNGITTLPKMPACPNLSTLLLQLNCGLNKIQNDFSHYMPALRVLDLSSTGLREIPASINKLIELRHLDLSRTKVAALPKELGGLSKLKYLDLQGTFSLKTIPPEAIYGLSELRVLNLFRSYRNWEANNEVDFTDLEWLGHLTSLGITVLESATLIRLNGFSWLLKRIQHLYIENCQGLFYLEFSSNSSHGKRLRRLSINTCVDLKHLAVAAGVGEDLLPSLEVLSLRSLPNLTTVWRNGLTRDCLQNLRYINISHCHKLKNVSWILQLPRLEAIRLFYCQEIEEIVSSETMLVEDSVTFPRLTTLSIRDLPKLTSITPWPLSFPSIKTISVIGCPRLKKLPVKVDPISTLPTVYGNKAWWDGLEWDEAFVESAFLPYFIAV